jgi:glutamate dehydrogenase
MKSLIALNADVNLATPHDQRTCLHLAAAGGHLDVVTFLVNEAGATMSKDRQGKFPFDDAKQHGHTDVRTLLLDQELVVEALPISDGHPFSEQMDAVLGLVVRDGIFSLRTVQAEVRHFYSTLGMHSAYFEHFTEQQISRHIQCLLAAKQVSMTRGERSLQFGIEDAESGFFLATLNPSPCHREAARLCTKYLTDTLEQGLAYSVTFMASSGSAFGRKGTDKLGIYIVDRHSWDVKEKDDVFKFSKMASSVDGTPATPMTPQKWGSTKGSILDPAEEKRRNVHDVDNAYMDLSDETDLRKIATRQFMEKREIFPEALVIFQRLIDTATAARSMATEVHPNPSPHAGGFVVFFAIYEMGGKDSRPMLADLQDLLWHMNLQPRRFYVDVFANGVQTYALFFPDAKEESLHELQRAAWYIQHTKRTVGSSLRLWKEVQCGVLTPEASIYMRLGIKFCFAFFPREQYMPQYSELQGMLHEPESKRKLDEMYIQSVREIITNNRIYDIVCKYIAFAPRFYADFKRIASGEAEPFWNEELAKEIEELVHDPLCATVLRMFLRLNHSVLMTNFFRSDQPPSAIAVRLNPQVVLDGRPKTLYPETPFGIYLIMGRNFHGFHCRFREIARGGVRVVRSRDQQAYNKNDCAAFEECYNLAYTQQLKNKDIPEGGAKGVILLDGEKSQAHSQCSSAGRDCFVKYMDALLDCMLKPAGIHSHVPHEELLFFGPDEGTADCMDIGARRARDRGHRYWKGLTTGKSVRFGGVPHDVYGITTCGVRTYVRELYRVLNLREESITKVQTGGPDGDLGSNEILQSKDKTVALVDVSGVAYDPAGLDRRELERLARERQQIKMFNRSHLGEGGFLVLLDETNVTLPDGSYWRTGLDLRDQFIFTPYGRADLFVPCGGRPATINAANVGGLLAQGLPWKMVVEGANLFITDPARRKFEEAGMHLFRDSTANKGGVTSSSLEVLASLSMLPEDHDRLLTAASDSADLPDFYMKYVESIIIQIEKNCCCEFKVIWDACQSNKGEPMHKIDASKKLSAEINSLQDVIAADVLEDELLREVLKHALPDLIVKHNGLDTLMKRLPEAYIKATCANYLASKYVYEHGIVSPNSFNFHKFMERFSQKGSPTTPVSAK